MRSSLENSKRGMKRGRPKTPSSHSQVSSKESLAAKRPRHELIQQRHNDVVVNQLNTCFDRIYNLMRASQSKRQPSDFQKQVFAAFAQLSDFFSTQGWDKFYEWADALPQHQRSQKIAFFSTIAENSLLISKNRPNYQRLY